MALSRDEILKASRPKVTPVQMKTIGGEVLLRQLSSSEVLGLNEKFSAGELSEENYTYAIVRLSVVDDDGNAVFDESTVKDVIVEVMTELATEIAKYNNLDIKKAEAAAALKKVRQKSS